MSDTERDKWDARYAAGAYADREHPTQLLASWLERLPQGRALDVACGAGRNALYLAELGFEVDAVDISGVALTRARAAALRRGVNVRWIEADLDLGDNALPAGPYALVVVVRYVNEDLYPALIERLQRGGCLLSEQHLVTDQAVIGPVNPAFRVPPGALSKATAMLDPLFYFEGIIADPDGRTAALAQVIAQR